MADDRSDPTPNQSSVENPLKVKEKRFREKKQVKQLNITMECQRSQCHRQVMGYTQNFRRQ